LIRIHSILAMVWCVRSQMALKRDDEDIMNSGTLKYVLESLPVNSFSWS
jgi:hypothetical protein